MIKWLRFLTEVVRFTYCVLRFKLAKKIMHLKWKLDPNSTALKRYSEAWHKEDWIDHRADLQRQEYKDAIAFNRRRAIDTWSLPYYTSKYFTERTFVDGSWIDLTIPSTYSEALSEIKTNILK